MKQLNKMTLGLLLCAYLFSPLLYAQEAAKKATVMVVTTVHWNMDKTDGSNDAWMALEKEYFDKVTSKNEFILRANFLTHAFTADNSEAIWVTLYENWDAIEDANDRTNELIMEGWPDEAARAKFMAEQSSYYTNMHSDEIYSVLDGGKAITERSTEPMIYYVRVSQMASPDDAVPGEMAAMRKEFNENVTFKNEYILGYYIYRHMWGADNRNLTEVYAVNSLCDIEASFDKNQELMDAKWSEDEQKARGEKMSKYWTGIHGDYIWRNVPALVK